MILYLKNKDEKKMVVSVTRTHFLNFYLSVSIYHVLFAIICITTMKTNLKTLFLSSTCSLWLIFWLQTLQKCCSVRNLKIHTYKLTLNLKNGVCNVNNAVLNGIINHEANLKWSSYCKMNDVTLCTLWCNIAQ